MVVLTPLGATFPLLLFEGLPVSVLCVCVCVCVRARVLACRDWIR